MTQENTQDAFWRAMSDIQAGRLEQGLRQFHQLHSQYPEHPVIMLNLGWALSKAGRIDEAISHLERGIALDSSAAWAINQLGLLLMDKNRHEEACSRFMRAAELDPRVCIAHNNLGMALEKLGRDSEAIEAFEKAAGLSPDSSVILINLGNALMRKGRIDEARSAYEKCVKVDPHNAAAWHNLSAAQRETGLMQQALVSAAKAVELDPNDASIHSNLVYLLHLDPRVDLPALLQEHLAWNQRHAVQHRAARRRTWSCDRDGSRELRVGFVSPNFKMHPVGRFFKPLIQRLDRSKVQTFCYSDVTEPDDLTVGIRFAAANWRDTRDLSNPALADVIAGDKIDILIDLTMHMPDNRLGLFALKPAPVQVAWLAYCSTTGLETMDYRISDRHMDPPGLNERHYSEKTVLLPRSYWCYDPPTALETGDSPALRTGYFTFGCLNYFGKINDGVIDAWSQILKRAAGSRLMLYANTGSVRENLRNGFAIRGVDPSRIDFVDSKPLEEYLGFYRRIDLALDPFPYNGGTTTCDALWMGVPVATLAGDRPLGRAGVSLLTNVGLESWIARDMDEYIKLAAQAPGRLNELVELRKTLRLRMLRSPLMDAHGFAREFEDLLRSLWMEHVKSI